MKTKEYEFDFEHLKKDLEFEASSFLIEQSFQLLPKKIELVNSLIKNYFGLGGIINDSDLYLKHTAFAVYHWEHYDLIRRSLLEALATYYNASSILLRPTFELIIKGILFQCICQQKFRKSANVLRKQKDELLEIITTEINKNPDLNQELQNSSVSLFDKVGSVFLVNYRPSIKQILLQFQKWTLLQGIKKPVSQLYDESYGTLSWDVHVHPPSLDVGRRIRLNETPFKDHEVSSKYLHECLDNIILIIDLSTIMTVNMFRFTIDDSKLFKQYLQSLANSKGFKELKLEYSPIRIKQLIQN